MPWVKTENDFFSWEPALWVEVEENINHLLNCEVLIANCKELQEDIEVQYEDIFRDPVKQLAATRLYEKVLETREKLMKNEN